MTVQTVTSENLLEFNASHGKSAFEKAEDKAKEIERAQEKTDESKEEGEPKEKKKGNPKIEQRFSELTSKVRAAEERAAAAEARAKELEAKSNPKEADKKPEDGPGTKPEPKDFTDAFEYAEALSDWKVKDAFHQREVKEAKERADKEQAKVLKAWQDRLDLAKSEIPDFEDMVASSNLSVSDVVRDTIIESEFGPKLLYHFASNEEDAAKLNDMTVKKALMYIAKMEAKYEAALEPKEKAEAKEEKEEKPKPKASAPITPIRASSANVSNPSELSYDQWKAQRRLGKI